MSPTPSPVPVPTAPFWPQDAVGWAGLITLALVILGAWFTYQQLRQTVTTRLAATMAEISRRWDEPLMSESRRRAGDFAPERLKSRVEFLWGRNDPELDILLRAPNFFEDLGVMEQSGALPFDLIRKSLGGTIVSEWKHWEPTIAWMRGDEKYDLVYENFEALMVKTRSELARIDLPGVNEAEERPSGTSGSVGP